MASRVPRRLLVIAALIVVQDLAFFAAISPLLPGYVDDLGLSESEAGVLTAAYPAGTLLAALPAGFIASRVGPRRTVLVGLLMMGASSVTFGFADSIKLLDGARFAQGIAGAMTWSGAFTWILQAESRERRGATIGTLLGLAVAGALLGPPLGALAAEIGTELVFGSVLALSLVLFGVAARLRDAGEVTRQPAREVLRTMSGRRILLAAAILTVPSVEFGATGVLVPLRVDELGGGPFVIALGFTVGAAAEAVIAPFSGRVADRTTWRRPYLFGLAITAVSIAALALLAELPLVVLGVVAAALGAGISFTPATKRVSDETEAVGLHQGMAAATTNLAWAGGEVLGATGAGLIADGAGVTAAFASAGAFLLVAAAAAAAATARR